MTFRPPDPEPEKARAARKSGLQPRALGRLAGVALGVGAAIACAYVVPALAALRPWVPGDGYVPFWNVVGRELLGEGKRAQAEHEALERLTRAAIVETPPVAPPSALPPAEPERLIPPYTAPAGGPRPDFRIEPPTALDGFFEKLTLVDLHVSGAIARAGHWGDSVLGLDGITSSIRRRLQSRFGDAGHGFHLLDRYNPSYRHQGIEFEPGEGWLRCLVINECNKQDHRYGYGGLLVRSAGGATAAFHTPKQGFGQVVSRFELWYARQPNGGAFEITIDHERKERVPTRGPELEDAWYEVRVPPGPHSFNVRAAGGGEVRGYGAVLENDGPGVVWDGMALIGGSTRGLRTQDVEHIATQIRHRDLDLIVFMFGGNDMQRNYVNLETSMEPYYDEYLDVLRHFRAKKPGLACLVMTLTDHGKRLADGNIVSRPFAKQLATAQREIARRAGCGFFDTYEATGGEGTVARWFRARPRLVAPDLGHPTSFGHEIIAGLLTEALLDGYADYRRRVAGRPLDELTKSHAPSLAKRRPDVSPGADPPAATPGSASPDASGAGQPDAAQSARPASGDGADGARAAPAASP